MTTTEPLPIPSWLVIDAVRYATGRMSAQVSTTCDWLVTHWDKLPDDARKIIARDLEEAFARDDEARADPEVKYGWPLGWNCDRMEWERVRALYRDEEEADTR